MDGHNHFPASVVITTKNRKEELRVALQSALKQSVPLEIVVIDDGSTDRTAEMVRSEFPQVQLHRFEQSQGLIVRRNQGAKLASGDIVFSIDDDAAFSTPSIVEQTLLDFEPPDIGAVAIPFVDVRKSPEIMQIAPDDEQLWITHTFIGTAHAIRRELFLELGGYREHLVHQGEESDYCIRLLAGGHVVRLGRADPIHHFESPRRDFRRMDFFGCRNAILFAWQNVPAPQLPVYLAATTVNCVRWTLDPKRLPVRMHGLLRGYMACATTPRRPVTKAIYRQWRALKTAVATRWTARSGAGDKLTSSQ